MISYQKAFSPFNFFNKYICSVHLNKDIYSNDIDLLLVYSVDKEFIVTEAKYILFVLYNCFQKPIDITVLSSDGLCDCYFFFAKDREV